MPDKYRWVRQSSNGSKWLTQGFYSFGEAYTHPLGDHDWWCSRPLYPIITNEDMNETQKLSGSKK